MTQLLYGTTNPGKLASMRRMLCALPVAVLGLRDVRPDWPAVEEQGRSPLDNARQKALAYHACTHLPVFSCDSGLYLEGVPDAEQPGIHARRVAGRALTDEEMIAHYAGWAVRMGGRITARYRNAICLVMPDGTAHARMDDTLAGAPFHLAAVPHAQRTPGFPLDSLSIHIPTGRYWFDLPESFDQLLTLDAGFSAFFRDVLGLA